MNAFVSVLIDLQHEEIDAMTAIQFQPTRYGFTAEVAGLTFHLRAVNRPDEPGLYVVYSRDWPESTCADLPEAREWLTEIARNHADSVPTVDRPTPPEDVETLAIVAKMTTAQRIILREMLEAMHKIPREDAQPLAPIYDGEAPARPLTTDESYALALAHALAADIRATRSASDAETDR